MCTDIAVALQHRSYQDHPAGPHLLEQPSRDPTFTKEEFDSYQRESSEIMNKLLIIQDPQQLSLLQECNEITSLP